ncbi:hypothetical protein, partial [Salmonella enterica]
LIFFFFFFYCYGYIRYLHSLRRRQRLMCISDSAIAVRKNKLFWLWVILHQSAIQLPFPYLTAGSAPDATLTENKLFVE